LASSRNGRGCAHPDFAEETIVTVMSEPKPQIGGPTGRYHCRFCAAALEKTFVDLGTSPLCQRHVTPQRFDEAEAFYPLHVYVCERCYLVQLPEYVSPKDIFSDYAYFSSYSQTWLNHVRDYAAQMVQRLELDGSSQVIEIASNDGYLLQFFKQLGVPVLGVEPAANVAEVAQGKGIPTVVRFFGRSTARHILGEQGRADLLLGNNVLAHVPNINDFVGGMKILLAEHGVITMEFPHLMQLVAQNQFDTIYHEHFSYLSLSTVEQIFAAHGLTLFDVEELPTHGGSLRIYARHTADQSKAITPRLVELRQREQEAGMRSAGYYQTFGQKVMETKRKLLSFLIEARSEGKTIAGYGAPGKGNTLLNYCGIRTDFIDYTVDRSPHKQGNFLPGTRIPICHPDRIRQTRPDYVLILPWNLKDEIMEQMADIRQWGGKFIVPIPQVQVL
jgi:2-polyprenyl-3-methyl-5-hydroxy-6-metoxy-1,4-benzoquinol methylase